MNPITDIEVIRACIFGEAVADALGVPVEFTSRHERDRDPVTGMRAYGTHHQPKGTWSDDTSMTLCALDALGDEAFSWSRVMDNFVRWARHDEFTATDETFDIGGSCSSAINRYSRRTAPFDCGGTGERDNGNGSLMRIVPFSLYAPDDPQLSEKASCLTHAHRISQMGCGIFTLVLAEIIRSRSKEAVYEGLRKAEARYGAEPEWKSGYDRLAGVADRERDSIISGGYVVTTLEAALWCLMTTESYRECALKAVNLGKDTDTVAAVAGIFAGALYGMEGIPAEWLDVLKKRDYIDGLCVRACRRWAEEA